MCRAFSWSGVGWTLSDFGFFVELRRPLGLTFHVEHGIKHRVGSVVFHVERLDCLLRLPG